MRIFLKCYMNCYFYLIDTFISTLCSRDYMTKDFPEFYTY